MENDSKIEGGVVLKEYSPEHAEGLWNILDSEIGENLGWDVKETVGKLREHLENKSFKFWSIFLNDRLIGGIFLDVLIHKSNVWEKRMANLGYFLDKAYRGKGYISVVVPRVISYAFNDLGLKRVKAGHLENNIASRRVIEKNGFKLVGIERNYARPLSAERYLNHYLYDLIPDEEA